MRETATRYDPQQALEKLPSRLWSWVYHEMRHAGQDEEHAMARADIVRIEAERWIAANVVEPPEDDPTRLMIDEP